MKVEKVIQRQDGKWVSEKSQLDNPKFVGYDTEEEAVLAVIQHSLGERSYNKNPSQAARIINNILKEKYRWTD